MIRSLTSPRSVTVIPESAARLSLGATVLFLGLLTVLHGLKSDLDPSWRVISEYAIGRHGWLMQLAFALLAVSCLTLLVAVRPSIRTTGGRIGLGCLVLATAGLMLAASFTTDPITTSRDNLTTQSMLHGLGTVLGIGLPVAAVLISRSLAQHPEWSSARPSLLTTAGVTWLGLLLFLGSQALYLPRNDGTYGPDVPIGWPNRLMMVAFCTWLLTVAWHAAMRDVRRTSTDQPGSG